MKRGELRVYLGSAPGVGKTFAMLNEGRRRLARGTDVVVAYVETHNRPRTAEQLEGLEVVPRRTISYRGGTFEEMDLPAVLARQPAVALVDELAHTNVPGSEHEKRWQDVQELLDAGITVISTVNIQHLESLNDVVEQTTGVRQQETIPDAIVRAADQVELVDMTPEALRRRMAHGNIYAAERVDAALSHYFRPGNLSALRELALLWLADKVEAALQDYMDEHGISSPWETRERVVVAVTGAPTGEDLIRRAARMARRSQGDLIGVHVRSDQGLVAEDSGTIDRQRSLVIELGGRYHEVVGSDVADTLLRFAQAEKATQLVLGASRRGRLEEVVRGSVVNRLVRQAGEMDVHVISNPDADGPGHAPAVRSGGRPPSLISRRRLLAGWLLVLLGLPLLTVLLLAVGDRLNLTSDTLLYLTFVGLCAAVGGRWPGVAAAVSASLVVNWFFTPPVHTFTVAAPENLLALAIFLGIAVFVSVLVSQLASRQAAAQRSRADAEALARSAGSLAGGEPLDDVLAHLRATYQLRAVALLEPEGSSWSVAAAAGGPVPGTPDQGTAVPLASGAVLVLDGALLSPDDLRIIEAFAHQLDTSLARRRLEEEAAETARRAEADHLRTSILRAVSHDLRTPLASIGAAAGSLADPAVPLGADDRRALAETIRDETDRLSRLVANLLDLSRLEAGALEVRVEAVALDEVVPAALSSLSEPLDRVEVDLDPDLPMVLADQVLLERVVANVVGNALRHAPAPSPVRVTGELLSGRVELRVADRGPGIAPELRRQAVEPFQRLGDQRGQGIGLGLAVVRGFVEVMRGTLDLEDTPGGGLTAVVSLPVAAGGRSAALAPPVKGLVP